MPQDQANFQQLLRSSFPIIIVHTHDEKRVVDVLRGVVSTSFRHGPLYVWSAHTGLEPSLENSVSEWHIKGIEEQARKPEKNTAAPEEALRHIKTQIKSGVVLLPDFHAYLTNPSVVRMVKEIAQDYANNPVTLVLVSHAFEVPPELQRLSVHFDISVPNAKKIRQILNDEVREWRKSNKDNKVKSDRKTLELLINNLTGLTESDSRRLIRGAIYDDSAITHSDVEEIMQAKYQMISSNGALRFEYDTASFADVGGFENLRKWLELRKSFFLKKGNDNDIDVPRGMLMVGVQGCGKSLAAKSVAGTWGVPLLKFDFGALFNKYIGESEKNIREALRSAELLAPCVLWVDEIEKAISGGNDETGTSQRILGTLLTWMSENQSRVFLVATSNNIEGLPPELVRKGRIDEIFFVDLPDKKARHEIFDLHLRKRNLNLSSGCIGALVDATEGFSGAEIEQAVVASRYRAHASNEEVSRDHVLVEIRQTQPLSVVRKEAIDGLRHWAEGRTVRA
jgi:SpoVK/Ycf46/Vps4 family AAA+-type ATPase